MLKRKEINFTVSDNASTRFDLKEKLAALNNADFDLVFIKHMIPRFGKLQLSGFATIYENAEATKIEPKYIRIRNMPKEKRDEARKAGHKPRKKKKGAD